MPQTDTYIEKDSSLNEEVEAAALSDQLLAHSSRRHRGRNGVGHLRPRHLQEYVGRMITLRVGQELDRDALLRRLVGIQYARNDLSGSRGTFLRGGHPRGVSDV